MVKKNYSFVFVLCAVFVTDVTCKHRQHGRSKNDEGKIVGGQNIEITKAPYQIRLTVQKNDKYYVCGGSIISSQYILTAAHCLTGISAATVRAGSTNSDSGGTLYYATEYSIHPKYNERTNDYDLGVVKVSQDIDIDGVNTKVVTLADETTNVPSRARVYVTGWGDTSENGQSSDNLKGVEVPVVSNTRCRMTYSFLTARMFCAGVTQGGKDSCQGDSGGPAVLINNTVQVGVVSFGYGCARPGTPGVYTRISAVRSWIRSAAGV